MKENLPRISCKRLFFLFSGCIVLAALAVAVSEKSIRRAAEGRIYEDVTDLPPRFAPGIAPDGIKANPCGGPARAHGEFVSGMRFRGLVMTVLTAWNRSGKVTFLPNYPPQRHRNGTHSRTKGRCSLFGDHLCLRKSISFCHLQGTCRHHSRPFSPRWPWGRSR